MEWTPPSDGIATYQGGAEAVVPREAEAVIYWCPTRSFEGKILLTDGSSVARRW